MKNNNGIYTLELNDSVERFCKVFEHNLAKINNNEKVNELYSVRNTIFDYTEHLKRIKLINNEEGRAFDFVKFLSLCGTVFEAVRLLLIYLFPNEVEKGKSMHQSLLGVKNGKECFCQNEYTDSEYFEYIRSLCSVHPTNTDRSAQGNDRVLGKNVLFNIKWGMSQTGGINDIYINMAKGDNLSVIKISIIGFEKFLNNYLTLLDDASNQINNMQMPIKRINGLEKYNGNYDEYLLNLQNECVARGMNYNLSHNKGLRKCNPTPYNFYRLMLRTYATNRKNEKLCQLYKNAIKYAFTKEHFRLENFDDYSKESQGINYKYEVNEEFSLLEILEFRLLDLYFLNSNLLLFTIDNINNPFDIGSIDERFNLLNNYDNEIDQEIRNYLISKKEIFTKYLEINWSENGDELVLLCNTAIYLYEVSKRCSILFNSIPNDTNSYDNYRDKDIEEEENGIKFLRESNDLI